MLQLEANLFSSLITRTSAYPREASLAALTTKTVAKASVSVLEQAKRPQTLIQPVTRPRLLMLINR